MRRFQLTLVNRDETISGEYHHGIRFITFQTAQLIVVMDLDVSEDASMGEIVDLIDTLWDYPLLQGGEDINGEYCENTRGEQFTDELFNYELVGVNELIITGES